MPISKIRSKAGDPAATSGEWTDFHFNRDDGGLKFVSLSDTVRPVRQILQTAKVPLVGTTMHAATNGMAAWVVPEAGAIIIHRVILDVTTASTGACTFDIGYTATSATTTNDSFLDGIDVSAAGIFDSMDAALDTQTNARAQRAAAGKWVVIDEKTGDATGLVGNLYITYQVL